MKTELKNKLLTKEQADTVEKMISGSMKDGFFKSNLTVPSNFYEITEKIAKGIVKKVQLALTEGAVFDGVLKDEKKVIKQTKKVVKKVKITKDGLHLVNLPKNWGKMKK